MLIYHPMKKPFSTVVIIIIALGHVLIHVENRMWVYYISLHRPDEIHVCLIHTEKPMTIELYVK